MKKTRKRITSFLMTIVLLISAVGVSLYAAAVNGNVSVNAKLLDSVLNNRSWIIDTLINGDISSNPYAVLNSAANDTLLFNEVLSNYKNDEAFKTVVDAMEYYSESGQYLSGFSNDLISKLLSLFGLSPDSILGDKLDKISASTSELKYESILNDVLKTDYTSSWGETLMDENMNLETLQQRAKILKKLSVYQTTLSDAINLNLSDSSAIVTYNTTSESLTDFDMSIQDYTGHFLSAYQADLEEYINDEIDIPALNGKPALKKKILASGALGITSLYEMVALPDSKFDVADESLSIDEIFYDGFLADTQKIVKGVGKTLSFAQKSVDKAILIESLQSQKNSTIKVMNRISANTSDVDLAKVCDNYADLVNSRGNKLSEEYETITNYLRNNQVAYNTVKNIVSKKVASTAPAIMRDAAFKIGGAKGLVLESKIASSITSVAALLTVGLWVVDKATSIEDTAKKIYVCKYLNKILKQAIATYRIDLKAYYSNKSDENAEKVLDDLNFIKALRLYGEKQAHGSICSQTNSWIGTLLGGDDVADFLEEEYQAHIDLLLGCTISPISRTQYQLYKNDVMSIWSKDINGNTVTVAYVHRGDKFITIPEADYRLLGGIKMNGATLTISSAPNGFYLPIVETSSGSSNTIGILCDNVAVGNIENNGNLTVQFRDSATEFQITDKFKNSGTTTITAENYLNIEVYDFENLYDKTVAFTNGQFNVKGEYYNKSTVNARVNICGDDTQSYENNYFTVKGQVISGTGTTSELVLNNYTKYGVKLNGKQTVTNYVENSRTRIKSPENIVLTGSCTVGNGKLKNAVSFKNFNSSQSFTTQGAYIYGDVTFNGTVTVDGPMYISCNQLTTNGKLNVNEDLLYKEGTIAGNDVLKIKGNLTVNAQSPSISNIEFSGLTQQTVKSDNVLRVGRFINNNTSLNGVTVNSKIYVTDTLDTGAISKLKNGKYITLTEDARVVSIGISNLSAENWECNADTEIKGILYTSGAVTTGSAVTLETNGYSQSSGTLNVGEGSLLNCSGDFMQCGETANNGEIIIKDDSLISSAFSGGTVTFKGDVTASADITVNTMKFISKLAQKFSNSKTTTVNKLMIDNSSSSGVTVSSIINVLDSYERNNSKVNSENNIYYNGTSIDVHAQHLTITGDTVVRSGENKVVNGKMIIKSDASLTVETGATVNVKQYLTSSGGTITVNEGGTLIVDDYLYLTSCNIICNGTIIIKSDVDISSSISGSGELEFMGDLKTSSCTWNGVSVTFNGKLAQSVSGSGIEVNNVTVNNPSTAGVKFNTTVSYSGEYNPNTSVITGGSNVKKIG